MQLEVVCVELIVHGSGHPNFVYIFPIVSTSKSSRQTYDNVNVEEERH